jgi:hypothetical protein
MIGPDELRELLLSHAATVEPVPHLAELGAALTNVERHRRNRVFVGTTIAAVAVTAAVAAVRTLEARPTRFDTAPATATRRVPVTASLASVPTTVAALPAATLPGADASTPGTPAPGTPVPTTPAIGAPGAANGQPGSATATGTPAPSHVLTFRASSVSDLSSTNPPAVDYFGIAPPGATVTATSAYGTASTQAGPDSKWALHLVLANAPIGQRVKVVLSAPPLPALTFTFTHTAG